MMAWIGVDLDGTLAHYGGWTGGMEIGPPVPAMLERVKGWLDEGREVRIFTARVAHDEDGTQLQLITRWCEQYIGKALEVTCCKDYACLAIYDDRAVQVETNTGRIVGEVG